MRRGGAVQHVRGWSGKEGEGQVVVGTGGVDSHRR